MKQIIIQEKTFEKARKKIRESRDKEIVFTSSDDELNRKVMEKEKINVLLINLKNRRDFSKQRNSGFNQVLAKIAEKQNIVIGINLDEIINSDKEEKARILARVRQNIKLCNKNKLKMKFVSLGGVKRDIYDLKSLGLVLGIPTWMVKTL